jgi:LPXTG-motif cell wall-anchored protein
MMEGRVLALAGLSFALGGLGGWLSYKRHRESWGLPKPEDATVYCDG